VLEQSEQDPFLKVPEVAARLRLSKTAVHNLITRGLLPHLNVGGGRRSVPRVRLSHLQKFIEERTRQRSG
jgi:excisionase family DNA binding protein